MSELTVRVPCKHHRYTDHEYGPIKHKPGESGLLWCRDWRQVVLRQVPPDANAAPLLRDADAGRVYVIVEGGE